MRISKENCTWLEAGSKRDQLRFDCAGASGSRVGSFRKTNKSKENKTFEPKHGFDADFVLKEALRMSPEHHKISPPAHLSVWPSH